MSMVSSAIFELCAVGRIRKVRNDGVDLDERKRRSADLLGIEIPEGEYKRVMEEDKETLRERVRGSENEVRRLIAQFEEKGYAKVATICRTLLIVSSNM